MQLVLVFDYETVPVRLLDNSWSPRGITSVFMNSFTDAIHYLFVVLRFFYNEKCLNIETVTLYFTLYINCLNNGYSLFLILPSSLGSVVMACAEEQ